MNFVLPPVLAVLYPTDQPPLNVQILSIPATLFEGGPGTKHKATVLGLCDKALVAGGYYWDGF